jgi:hypothetical protein
MNGSLVIAFLRRLCSDMDEGRPLRAFPGARRALSVVMVPVAIGAASCAEEPVPASARRDGAVEAADQGALPDRPATPAQPARRTDASPESQAYGVYGAPFDPYQKRARILIEELSVTGEGDDEKVLRSRVRRELNVSCYRDRVEERPDLAGRASFTFELDNRGRAKRVKLVRSTLHDPELEKCLVDSVGKLQADCHEGDSRYPVKLKLSFEYSASKTRPDAGSPAASPARPADADR